METRHDEIFSGLRNKIKRIISLYEDQKAKCIDLQNKNRELTGKVELLEKRLGEVEENFENVKTAKVLSSVSGEDIHDTKIKVNRIVREIDKCIALLNR